MCRRDKGHVWSGSTVSRYIIRSKKNASGDAAGVASRLPAEEEGEMHSTSPVYCVSISLFPASDSI